MSHPYQIGVLGCGQFAATSAIPAILDSSDLFTLGGVASRSPEKAEQFAEQFNCSAYVGYETLVANPDIEIIYLPLPTGLHDEWVEKALVAGKHVLVEKSMAANLASAKAMVELARMRNKLLCENFMFQYHGQMAVVREKLDAGVIGELRQFRSSFGFPPLSADNFRFDASLGGGALLDAGAYTLRAAQLFLGNSLRVKSACLSDTMSSGVDTLGSAHLVNADGVSAMLGFGFDNFYQCNFELWGSQGKITATRAFTAKPGFSPELIIERQGETEHLSVESDYPFRNLLSKIHEAVGNENFESFWQEALNQATLISQVKAAANE